MPDLDTVSSEDDAKLMRSIARELAYDILPLQTILNNHKVSSDEWEKLSKHHEFQRYLREFIEQWSTAENSAARTKLKIVSGIEESLPDMFQLLYDNNFSANARVELFKTLLQAGGLRGTERAEAGGMKDKISITINMGDGRDVTVEADASRPAIDYEGAEDA